MVYYALSRRERDKPTVGARIKSDRKVLEMMSVQEIKKAIENERRHITRRMRDIDLAKSDIKVTRKAIKFWEGELKKAKKLEK